MTKALKFNLLLTIFLIPIMTPFQNFGYEHSKILIFIFLTSLSGFLWMGKGFEWSGISKAGGILMLILLITSFTGTDPKTSLLGADPYFQGWVLYAYLWLFSLMVASSKIKFKHYACVLTGSSVLVGLLAIKEWVAINLLGQYLPTYAGRVVSTFGQPNFYAGFILLTLPFFQFLLTKKPVRWWLSMMGFLISITAIVLSESRTAYFLLAGLLMAWLIEQLRGKRKLILGAVLAIVISAMTLSIFLSSGFFWEEFIKPHFVSNPDLTRESVENRIYIWPLSWQLFLQKPFLGYGLENIASSFANYFKTNKHTLFEENLQVEPVLLSLKELDIDRTHNYLLDLLLFSGIMGLAVWLWLIWLLLKKAKNNQILLVSLITYLIWIQFHNQSLVHLMYFWLLVGLIQRSN